MSPVQPPERYIRERQIALGKSIAKRTKIYLDLRYWIFARDAASGARTDVLSRKLLHFLRRGVANGSLICPIGASSFAELMKQRFSEGRRIGTARLIDELSQGVAIIPTQIVSGTEIAHCFHAAANLAVHDLHELVWTKVGFVLGDLFPSEPQLESQPEQWLQTQFIDKMWDVTLSEIVGRIGDAWTVEREFDELSERITRENAAHAEGLRSFEGTYRDEATGVADLFAGTAAEIVAELARRKGQESHAYDWHVQMGLCRNLLRNALRTEKGKRKLKTLFVAATLHASARWNKGRRFKANDFYDFDHAAVALSYCDVFLTEGPLHDMTTSPQLGFSDICDCRVICELGEAVELLAQLSRPPASP